MKVLLANIGNRNITFKGKYYSSKTDEINFREWSKSLLEDYTKLSQLIELNILDKVLTQFGTEIRKVYIFASDQTPNHPQDTIFEAEIIKHLIIERFGINEVEIKRQKVNVVDNNELLKYYQKTLVSIDKYNSMPNYILCDAGGTPQQKSSLKLMTEYLIGHKRYEAYYVSPNKKGIVKVEQIEYRNIISLEQAIMLLNSGMYNAALRAINQNPKDYISKIAVGNRLLIHAYYRFNNNVNKAKSALASMKYANPIFNNFKQGTSLADNQELELFFGKDKFLKLTERLYKVIFLLEINEWSNAILSFSHFYELFLNLSVGKLDDIDQLESLARDQYSSFLEIYNGVQDRSNFLFAKKNNVASQSLLLSVCHIEDIKLVANLLLPYVTPSPFTIDDSGLVKNNLGYMPLTSLRNPIAHEGKLITTEEFDSKVGYLNDLVLKIKDILGLTKTNIYMDLNEIIEQKLRN